MAAGTGPIKHPFSAGGRIKAGLAVVVVSLAVVVAGGVAAGCKRRLGELQTLDRPWNEFGFQRTAVRRPLEPVGH